MMIKSKTDLIDNRFNRNDDTDDTYENDTYELKRCAERMSIYINQSISATERFAQIYTFLTVKEWQMFLFT